MYRSGEARPGLSPGQTLATQVEHFVAQGGGDVTLTEGESEAAAAVACQWRDEKAAAPASAKNLCLLLALGPTD